MDLNADMTKSEVPMARLADVATSLARRVVRERTGTTTDLEAMKDDDNDLQEVILKSPKAKKDSEVSTIREFLKPQYTTSASQRKGNSMERAVEMHEIHDLAKGEFHLGGHHTVHPANHTKELRLQRHHALVGNAKETKENNLELTKIEEKKLEENIKTDKNAVVEVVKVKKEDDDEKKEKEEVKKKV